MRLGKGRKSPDEMTFLEHLEDLRKRLFYSFVALFVGFIPGWIFSKELYAILARPVTQYLPPGTKLAFTTLTAPFMLYMKTAFLASLFFMSPFVFLQLWYFIAPGLYQKEKKYVVPFVLMTTFFFTLGALFAYFIVFPWACRFFLQMGQDFQAVITVDQYFGFALKVLLGIALIFELPTLIFFLARMGLVTAGWMVRNFKYAVLGRLRRGRRDHAHAGRHHPEHRGRPHARPLRPEHPHRLGRRPGQREGPPGQRRPGGIDERKSAGHGRSPDHRQRARRDGREARLREPGHPRADRRGQSGLPRALRPGHRGRQGGLSGLALARSPGEAGRLQAGREHPGPAGHRDRRLIAMEKGSPYPESLAVEVFGALQSTRFYGAQHGRLLRPKRDGHYTPLFLNKSADFHFHPLGPTLIISPWNFPFLIPMFDVLSALTAGNTVVLRPSTATPFSALAHRRDLPRGRAAARRPQRRRLQDAPGRGHDRRPRHPDRHVHRQRRHRQAHHGALQPEPDQPDPRARRQGPDDRPRGRRPRTGGARGRLDGLHELRPELRFGRAGLRRAAGRRGLHGARRRAGPRDQGRRSPRTRASTWARWPRPASSRLVEEHIADARARGAGNTARRRAGPGRPAGYFLQPTVLTGVDHTMRA